MTLETRHLDYSDGVNTYKAMMIWDNKIAGKRPAVLVSHTWAGRGEFEINKAKMLAESGYVGIAIDMYGDAKLGSSVEENTALMTPLVEDRSKLQQRITLALNTIKAQTEVDANNIAAIGFCFGGLCVLDLARTGVEIKGVISFHGLLGAPNNTQDNTISAKVLCLHGWDDPLALPENMLALSKEMTEAQADWQVHAYGNTVHAFTNPEANMPEMGMIYSETAERRALQSMHNFLREIFS